MECLFTLKVSSHTKPLLSLILNIRYLPGTKDHDILFGPNATSGVVGYTDSDFARCVDSRKSISGYCFKFSNGAISWKSKLQEWIATSTTEAEYVAVSDGRLARTFQKVHSDSAPVFYSDSQGVVALSKNPVHHNVSKHIDVGMKIFVHRRKHERREQNWGVHRCTRTCFICKIPIKTNINYKVLEMHH